MASVSDDILRVMAGGRLDPRAHERRFLDRLDEVVEDAIAAGMTPSRFANEAAEAWQRVLDEQKHVAASQWRDVLETPHA